jgi:hypothetical protein
MAGLIARCMDDKCPVASKCLRYQVKSSSDSKIYAWYRGPEDSCEYFLPLQQDELRATRQSS